ncbi:hypothetical protein AMS68_001079 [Peltaster fructicola]|uniref:Pre-mRNA-splicing factor SYF2 n=1 Tax=Peltaster fructicola TaxID=286661 RepID=A0A6H0XLD8_9PEZI|nr:hypothetical protein AMS68_001079 [Peltaster fructicola]
MAQSLKRKGSPGLEDEADYSNKRTFAEAEPATQDGLENTAIAKTSPSAEPDTADAAATDRAARFAALRARNKEGRKSNLVATKTEAQRQSTDTKQLTALHRKRDIAAHKLLKADTEAAGEDFERKRAWDWTIEESEKWDERLAEKAKRKQNVGFADYRQEAGKVYDRQIERLSKAHGERKEEYDRDKRDAIDRAVKSGGLEIVETESGELIAVDKDGSFYSTADSTQFVQNKPDRAAVDRLVEDIRQAEEMRLKKRRERGRGDDDGDVTYINEKNKQFNQKLARFYNKYTADIRESFERGTAI